MRLSPHFKFEEMCVTEVRHLQDANEKEAMEYTAVLKRVCEELLEPIRKHYCLPIVVTSGYRGRELNKLIGGSSRSAHCWGQAVDFNILTMRSGLGRSEIVEWIHRESHLDFRQLILEAGCVHISLPRGDDMDGQVFEYNVKTKKKTWIRKPGGMK